MRILYFTREYTSHDYRFLTALSKIGHKVYYLRLEQRDPPLEDRPLPSEIEMVSWKGGNSPVRLVDGPELLLDLEERIRRIQPDLIQAGPLQRSAFLVALTGFHPLVSMSWGYDLIRDARRNRFWQWVTRYTLKHSEAMVGDCETIRQIAKSYGMPDELIVTFPWGVDLNHFNPADEKETHDDPNRRPFTLLSTRSWEPVYGVDIIAQAFAAAISINICGINEIDSFINGGMNGSQSIFFRYLPPLRTNRPCSQSNF